MHLGTISFSFIFLPAFLILYWLAPRGAKKPLLAVASMLFYAWGNWMQLPILLLLGLISWGSAGIGNSSAPSYQEDPESSPGRLGPSGWTGIALNIAALAWFKYFKTPIGMPIGISFYVFHNISYIIDCRRNRRNGTFLDFFCYLLMFPKLDMGPITRWDQLEPQLTQLSQTEKRFFLPPKDAMEQGSLRFAIGFAKKAVLAGGLATLCGTLWEDAPNSMLSAWFGAIAYALQLYYDFSGYSDMAIGIGQLLGFELPQNFDHPYASCSVSEFWRRWHMSLGAWFRTYVYIPLGGNRKGERRTILNLMIVWTLTGIWHGDTLNFLVWGLGLGVAIVIERVTRFSERVPRPLGWLWCNFLVLMGWVLFNSENLGAALAYFGCLFHGTLLETTSTFSLALHDGWPVLLLAAVGAAPTVSDTAQKIASGMEPKARQAAEAVLLVLLMGVSVFYLVNSGYTAFIYFKF